jgi:hypothetical protein
MLHFHNTSFRPQHDTSFHNTRHADAVVTGQDLVLGKKKVKKVETPAVPVVNDYPWEEGLLGLAFEGIKKLVLKP